MAGEERTEADKPAWWRENERIKADLDLPQYEPPQFADGTYTYTVVEPLEERYDCEIRFIGINPLYPDDWMVRIDHVDAFSIGRRRNEHGNTVYRMDAESFRTAVRSFFSETNAET